MSRRPSPRKPARKKGQLPVILWLLAPIWGPVVLLVRRHKKAAAKAASVTKADLAAVASAVKTGDLSKLQAKSDAVEAAKWSYKNRHVLRAAQAAGVLAASKVLVLGPSLLPLVGLLAFVALLVGAVVWLGRLGRNPMPELKEALLDRKRVQTWPLKLRATLARLLAPQTGGIIVVLAGLWWWATPLDRKPAVLIWLIGTVLALSVRAWRFRVRAFEVAAPSTGTREGDWDVYVADKVEAAKGSILQGTDDFHRKNGDGTDGARLGWSGGVILARGSVGASAVAPALTGRIATTYGVGVEDVMIERFEKPEGGFDESRFVLTVLDEPGSNAVLVVHEYDGSDFDPAEGTWTQGIRADWKPAVGQLYKPGVGGFSTHFSGETGGGKSEGMETMLRSVTAKGVVAPYVIDLGGATFVDWREHVEVFVDRPDDAVQLLSNHGDLIQHRQRKLGTMRQLGPNGEDEGPRRVYPIDAEHPCICGIFDEWEFALGDPVIGKPVLELSERILTQQRKVVCPMCVAGQSTGLKAGFKNSQRARTQFQAGNMIAYKNNSEAGAQAFGKQIAVNPSNLPLAHKGSCYMTSNVDARDAMARSRWVRRPRLWDAEIDIPAMPRDEIDILTRGLSWRPAQIQVPAGVPSQRPEPNDEPVIEPPTLRAVKPASTLAADIRAWLAEQDEPVRRDGVVKEFRNNRTQAGSRAIDNALSELKADPDSGVIADAKGFYSIKKESVA